MYSDVYEDEFDDSYDAYCPKRSHKEDELLEPQVDMLDLNVRKYRDYSVNFSGRNGNLER